MQYADADPVNNRHYRLSKERLKEAYNTFRNEKVDFVINLGDLIDKEYKSFRPVMEIIDASKIKTYHLPGNHDYSVADSLKKMVPYMLKTSTGYSSLKSEGFRFIFLDGNEISTYVQPMKDINPRYKSYLEWIKIEKKINAMDWNGGIGPQQFGFLERELEYAMAKHEIVIISCHFPVYPEDVHNLLNYDEVLGLLKKYNNVIAWFSGHNHAGNYGNIGRTHFVSFKGMVETAGETSYAIVKVFEERITIKGFGREADRELNF